MTLLLIGSLCANVMFLLFILQPHMRRQFWHWMRPAAKRHEVWVTARLQPDGTWVRQDNGRKLVRPMGRRK
jgi:hypothetical protein